MRVRICVCVYAFAYMRVRICVCAYMRRRQGWEAENANVNVNKTCQEIVNIFCSHAHLLLRVPSLPMLMLLLILLLFLRLLVSILCRLRHISCKRMAAVAIVVKHGVSRHRNSFYRTHEHPADKCVAAS